MGNTGHLKKSLGNKSLTTAQLPNGPPPGYANAYSIEGIF